MPRRSACLIVALLMLAWPGLGIARDLTTSETRSLEQTVAEFEAAIRAMNLTRVVETIPPRILDHLAAQAGMPADKMRGAIVTQMSRIMKGVKLEAFAMDVAAGERRQTDDGTPFLLIPTRTVIDAGDAGRIEVRSHTLAMMDGGTWYLVRVSDASQVVILRQVYPAFAGVTFPSGSTKALK